MHLTCSVERVRRLRSSTTRVLCCVGLGWPLNREIEFRGISGGGDINTGAPEDILPLPPPPPPVQGVCNSLAM